jgi:cysteine dioxygenase
MALTVNSLEKLIVLIKENTPTKDLLICKDILNSYQGEDWKNKVKFSKDDTYKKNLVYKDDDFDMYVICWKGGQRSKFHDHAENGCLLKVLEGSISEIRKEHSSVLTTKTTYKVGDINFMNNKKGVHKIINSSDKPAVTLHIYSPANYKCKVYDE